MRMTTVQSLPERGKTLHAAMLPGKSGAMAGGARPKIPVYGSPVRA